MYTYIDRRVGIIVKYYTTIKIFKENSSLIFNDEINNFCFSLQEVKL